MSLVQDTASFNLIPLSAEAAVELVTVTDELDLGSSVRLLERHLANGGQVDVLIPLTDLYSKAGRRDKEIELLRRSVSEGEPSALHILGLALGASVLPERGYRSSSKRRCRATNCRQKLCTISAAAAAKPGLRGARRAHAD
jgi:hypothetical protein